MLRTIGRRTFDFDREVAVMAIINRTPDSFYEPEVADAVAEAGATLVVTHTGGPPRTRPHRPAYADVVAEVAAFLASRAAVARHRGVPRERLIVDPGHDFHKNTFHSLELTRRLGELRRLGYPLLVALSNKDFVGETLGVPLDQRLEGSLAATVACVLNGANVVRAHEVGATVRAVRMTEAILGRRRPAATRRGLA